MNTNSRSKILAPGAKTEQKYHNQGKQTLEAGGETPVSTETIPESTGESGSSEQKKFFLSKCNHKSLRPWIVSAVLILAGVYFLVFFRYPVVINYPGPTFDVLGKNQAGIPLIEVKGAKTYPNNNGELRMTTVSSLGGPGSVVNGTDIIWAMLSPHTEILSEQDVYPQSMTSKEIQTIGVQQMDQSQLAAQSVALTHLGYKVDITWEVVDIPKKSPAYGTLKRGDILESISAAQIPSTRITTLESLKSALRKIPAHTDIQLGVRRKGKDVEVKFPTMQSNRFKGSQLGVLLSSKVKLPLEIKFHLQDVGGPSAGTMFALGIVEQLTAEKITSKHPVAGTGTIDLDGKVGPISGIAQKMAGARQDGAEYFLAPRSNCKDTTGNIPTGLKVTPVSSFSEALAALKKIKENHGEDLPSCPSSK